MTDGFYVAKVGGRWFDVAVASGSVVIASPHDGGEVPWDEMQKFSGQWMNASPFPVPATPASKRADYAKPTSEMQSRVNEAMELIEQILSGSENIPERGADFAASVSEKASDIGRTIEERGVVTSNQLAALENMMAGVSRWIDR